MLTLQKQTRLRLKLFRSSLRLQKTKQASSTRSAFRSGRIGFRGQNRHSPTSTSCDKSMNRKHDRTQVIDLVLFNRCMDSHKAQSVQAKANYLMGRQTHNIKVLIMHQV